MGFQFSYSKSMANFEVFRWNISSSINLLFLKSAILAYRISNFVATLFYITLVECKIFIHKYLPRYSVFFPQNRILNLYYSRLLKKSKTSETLENILEPKWMKLSRKYYRIWKIYKQFWSAILNSKSYNAKLPTSAAEMDEFQTFYLRHI